MQQRVLFHRVLHLIDPVTAFGKEKPSIRIKRFRTIGTHKIFRPMQFPEIYRLFIEHLVKLCPRQHCEIKVKGADAIKAGVVPQPTGFMATLENCHAILRNIRELRDPLKNAMDD